MKKTQKAKKGTMKKVLSEIKRYSPLLVISLLLAAVSVALTLLIPILVGKTIDQMISAGNVSFHAIIQLLFGIGVSTLLCALCQWVMTAINNRISFSVVRDLRQKAFEKLQRLPFSYLDSKPSGDIVSRIIADADSFGEGLLLGFAQLFTGICTIAGTLIFMFLIRWQIALVVVLITPLSLFVARFISKKTYSMFRLQSETRGEQTAFMEEAIGGQSVVKAFGREEENQKRFDSLNQKLFGYSLRAVFFSSLTNPMTRFVNSIVYAGVGLVGALSCISTGFAFSVGNLTSLLSYANQYTKPFNEISGVVTEFQNALACASRLFELLEEEELSPDPEKKLSEQVKGSVEFQNVSFSYTPDKKLIENFNLCVSPGSRVAIVGPTGCGKTTLINLLMRFYDVKSGKILIDGEDISSVSRESLRAGYGMVLQDTWIRSGTIRDNIRLSRPDASEEEIVEAAKKAHAHSFIRRLPEGYDTVLSEDGGSLSQGQKQLLCIARIMLAVPPILILDEATSSIDTRTEWKVQKAFESLMQGRTSFIVAHRLSTIRTADIILVMRDGNVVEKGNHKELLKKGGFYARLYNSQFAH